MSWSKRADVLAVDNLPPPLPLWPPHGQVVAFLESSLTNAAPSLTEARRVWDTNGMHPHG